VGSAAVIYITSTQTAVLREVSGVSGYTCSTDLLKHGALDISRKQFARLSISTGSQSATCIELIRSLRGRRKHLGQVHGRQGLEGVNTTDRRVAVFLFVTLWPSPQTSDEYSMCTFLASGIASLSGPDQWLRSMSSTSTTSNCGCCALPQRRPVSDWHCTCPHCQHCVAPQTHLAPWIIERRDSDVHL
jgi:hypothetical protein